MSRRRISLADVNPALLPDVRARYAQAVGARDAVDYHARAQQHRPADPHALREECRRLHRELGLSAVDVAAALRISPAVAHEAIGSDA